MVILSYFVSFSCKNSNFFLPIIGLTTLPLIEDVIISEASISKFVFCRAVFILAFVVDDSFIFIHLLRESGGGATHRTNPDSLTSCFCFRVLRLSFASYFFNLLLVRFHRVGIIVIELSSV